jgi:hypothetical protein
MRCYYHQDKEAVGGCKSCGKGLCRECAADLGKGLACRGRCEADVQAAIASVDRNVKLSETTSRLIGLGRSMWLSAATFYLVLSVVFLGWGFPDFERYLLLHILGICFLIYGGYGFLQARKLAREKAADITL